MEYRQVLHNLTWAINFLMIDGMWESGRRDAGEGDLQGVCSRLAEAVGYFNLAEIGWARW